MHLSKCGKFLVTSATFDLNDVNFGIVTLRKFTSPEEVTVIHQQKLIAKSGQYIIDLFVDQNYVIVWNHKQTAKIIQVRSTRNFDVLHSIVFVLNSTLLHYSDGLLMMAINKRFSLVK